MVSLWVSKLKYVFHIPNHVRPVRINLESYDHSCTWQPNLFKSIDNIKGVNIFQCLTSCFRQWITENWASLVAPNVTALD